MYKEHSYSMDIQITDDNLSNTQVLSTSRRVSMLSALAESTDSCLPLDITVLLYDTLIIHFSVFMALLPKCVAHTQGIYFISHLLI